MGTEIRPARPSDFPTLLAWRNDPVTRANSRRTQLMQWEDYRRELEAVISAADKRLLIAELDDVPFAMVRADYLAASEDWEVSLTVAPTFRGRGLGRSVVKQALDQLFPDAWPPLRAEIRPHNLPSRRLFEALGFQPAGEHGDCLVYRRGGAAG